MSLQLCFCLLLLTPPSFPQPESPPPSKSLVLHQIWERGDLREVNLGRRGWTTRAQAAGGYCAGGPLTFPTEARFGARAAEPRSTRPSRRRARQSESSPRLSQTTVAALKKLLLLAARQLGGCTRSWGGPLSVRVRGLPERCLTAGGIGGKDPPPSPSE